MIYINTPNYVEMDTVHIDLIKATAMALKPLNMLELGMGSGKVTAALMEASMATGFGQLTVVDNWVDWNGVKPNIHNVEPYIILNRLQIITKSEESFVAENEDKPQYDLIVSDADHHNSHKWWHMTLSMLKYEGVAFFHDVCNRDFPNLNMLVYDIDAAGYQTKIFKNSSHPFERCNRGLLMVWKA